MTEVSGKETETEIEIVVGTDTEIGLKETESGGKERGKEKGENEIATIVKETATAGMTRIVTVTVEKSVMPLAV